MFLKKIFLSLLTLSALIISCDGDGVSSNSSVSGRFIAEDGKAVEGALVRVFAVRPFDTMVTRLRSEYKNLGTEISDATEFDHRFYGKPLAEGKTGSDGKFSISGVSGGTYHVSVTHPQYSWRYIYRTGGSLGDVKTKPVKEISGVLTGNTVWDDAGQDYVITGNATQNGGSLTIKSGVRVRLGSQRRLTVLNGNLVIEGSVSSPVWVTSDSDSSDNRFSAGLQAVSSSVQVSGAVVSGSVNGMTCRDVTNGKIANTIFRNSYVGLYLVQCNGVEVNKCNLEFNGENSILAETITGKLTSCIIGNNEKTAVQLSQSANCDITGSFVSGKGAAVHSETKSSANIKTSELSSENTPVLASRGSSAMISQSNLLGTSAIIVLRAGDPTVLNTLAAAESNFYTPAGSTTIIEVQAEVELMLTKVYFNRVNTLKEYQDAIVYGYGNPNSKVLNDPMFAPVNNAGIPK